MVDAEQIKKDIKVVCQCRGVRFKTIREAILKGSTTIEAIRKTTKANTGCGQLCTPIIQEMIEEYSVPRK